MKEIIRRLESLVDRVDGGNRLALVSGAIWGVWICAVVLWQPLAPSLHSMLVSPFVYLDGAYQWFGSYRWRNIVTTLGVVLLR